VIGSTACGLEALEGRQFLSTTYVAKQPTAPLGTHHAATVKPLVRTSTVKTPAPSVKRSRAPRATVIQLDGPGPEGDYSGDLSFPNDTFKVCDISIGPGDANGRFPGVITLTTLDPQTEAPVGQPVVLKVLFTVNAAGDFRVLHVARNVITVIRGQIVDGTLQGQFQQWNRNGTIKGDIFTYANNNRA
jgi:hypothetical protein